MLHAMACSLHRHLIAKKLSAVRFSHLFIQDKHLLIRMDSTMRAGTRAVVAPVVCHNWPVISSWSQQELIFLLTTHILGDLIRAAYSILRQVSLWDEWRLHLQTVHLIEMIQSGTETSVASQDSSLCPLCEEGSDGTALTEQSH